MNDPNDPINELRSLLEQRRVSRVMEEDDKDFQEHLWKPFAKRFSEAAIKISEVLEASGEQVSRSDTELEIRVGDPSDSQLVFRMEVEGFDARPGAWREVFDGPSGRRAIPIQAKNGWQTLDMKHWTWQDIVKAFNEAFKKAYIPGVPST